LAHQRFEQKTQELLPVQKYSPLLSQSRECGGAILTKSKYIYNCFIYVY